MTYIRQVQHQLRTSNIYNPAHIPPHKGMHSCGLMYIMKYEKFKVRKEINFFFKKRFIFKKNFLHTGTEHPTLPFTEIRK